VRLALKLGVRKTFEGDVSWLEPVSRKESDVRDAVGRLSEPAQRAAERLFWFHGRVTPTPARTVAELERAVGALLSVASGDSGDPPAAARHSAASPDDALHDGAVPCAALHDAALLALAGLVRLDPALRDAGAWARALDLWRRTFEAEEFWSLLVAADLKGDYEQPVTFGEVRELRLRAPRLVSVPVAARAREAALHGNLRACTHALAILRGAHLPAPLLEEYERETIGPVEDGLIEKLDAAFAWVGLMGLGAHSASTRRNYCNQAWRRFELLRPRLVEFVAMAGNDSYAVRRVCEHAATKLQRLAEAFDNAGRREESLFVCLKARALAPPGCEELPAIEEKLRALGAGAELRERTPDEYAQARARELADERVPSKLFKDDPKGGKTLDSFTSQGNSSGGCLPGVVLLMIVAAFFGLQECGVIKTSPSHTSFDSFPSINIRPETPNLNFTLYNVNIPPLNLRLYSIEPRGVSKPRGRRRTNRRREPPGGTNEGESSPSNLGGPANSNAPPRE
jgi:hypothetical protein